MVGVAMMLMAMTMMATTVTVVVAGVEKMVIIRWWWQHGDGSGVSIYDKENEFYQHLRGIDWIFYDTLYVIGGEDDLYVRDDLEIER
ncbi:hypothetical protein ACFX13_019119 [Malus domestica]